MKNIKLILLILCAFILIPVVYAEECDEEAINQMREELANSDYSLKLEYNEKEKSMYAKIVDLPEGYEAFIVFGTSGKPLSETEKTKIKSGLGRIVISSKTCGIEVVSSDVKIPKYNTENKDAFADGSVVEKNSNMETSKKIIPILVLSSIIIALLFIGYLLFKGRLKNEE